MHMSKHCIPLNLKINPVTVDHSTFKNAYQTTIHAKYLNPDILSFLKKYDMRVSYAEAFYSPPNYIQKIHTDNSGGDYVKLNFVYGGAGSNMHWYKVKEGVKPGTTNFTPDEGTTYIPWNPSMVDLVESNDLAYPSFVQVGCPHNITNANEHRLCILLVLIDTITFKRITIDLAENRLTEYLIGAT